MTPIVQLDDVSISLSTKTVIKSLSYQFERNGCYAITGNNGSGKTTLLRTIAGLIKPTEGNVSIHVQSIGYAPDHFRPPKWISVYIFMKYIAKVIDIKQDLIDIKIIHILESVGLQKNTQALCSTLSRGQMKRLCIAQACLGNPELLLLDEPFSGVDEDGIITITQLMHSLLEMGITIIHATHVTDTTRDIIINL
jgi:ABC-type multidrug transport system ATPase subunit